MTTSAISDVKRKAGDGVKASPPRTLSAAELRKLDAYWRALNGHPRIAGFGDPGTTKFLKQ